MTSDKLKAYFLFLLSKKDYSEGELRDKANLKGYESEEIEFEIKYLKLNNYLNDERLAQNILDFYGGKKGENWLKQKMFQRKISSDIINKTISGFDDYPDEKLRFEVERKYNITNWQEVDIKTKQKVLNFLGYRGFKNPYQILKDWSSEK